MKDLSPELQRYLYYGESGEYYGEDCSGYGAPSCIDFGDAKRINGGLDKRMGYVPVGQLEGKSCDDD